MYILSFYKIVFLKHLVQIKLFFCKNANKNYSVPDNIWWIMWKQIVILKISILVITLLVNCNIILQVYPMPRKRISANFSNFVCLLILKFDYFYLMFIHHPLITIWIIYFVFQFWYLFIWFYCYDSLQRVTFTHSSSWTTYFGSYLVYYGLWRAMINAKFCCHNFIIFV